MTDRDPQTQHSGATDRHNAPIKVGIGLIRRGGLRIEMVSTNVDDFEKGLWTMRAYTRLVRGKPFINDGRQFFVKVSYLLRF